MATEGDLIEPLKAELELQAGRQVIRKENEADAKRLTIMGDKDIPYRLLRKIMFTGAARQLRRRVVRGAAKDRGMSAARHDRGSPARASPFRTPVLPWTLASDDEARFRRIAQRVLLRLRGDLHRHALAAGLQARSGQGARAGGADGARS